MALITREQDRMDNRDGSEDVVLKYNRRLYRPFSRQARRSLSEWFLS